MDVVVNLLFWLHLVALVGAGASGIAMPFLGRAMATAGAESRTGLLTAMSGLRSISRGALGLLIITGPLLFWLKWDFSAPSQAWFGIKMVLVLAILIAVVVSGLDAKRASPGDAAARQRGQRWGRFVGIALLGTILAAVFAFE